MKKAKEFILGALVGSMVMGGCVTTFGSNGTKTIQAVYKNIKVIIDGKELKTDKEPFTYDGTTYLPVRAVAEAVGKEVKWDSATQTVILNSVATEEKTEKEKDVQKEIEKEEPADDSTVRVNKMIIDENGVKIRFIDMVKETGYSGDRYKFNFKLKNSTSMNYGASLNKVYINDKLLEPAFYANLVPTAEVTDDMTIWKKDLDSVGIAEIKKIKISFHIYNSDSYSDSFDTKEVELDITK